MNGFPDSLKACRQLRQWSQEKAAVQCGISYGTFRRYETGRRIPNLLILCAMADAFGVTLDQLAGRAPLPEEPQS